MELMVQRLRASWKLAAVLLHLLRGWWTVLLVFPGLSSRQQEDQIRGWALSLLGLLAIKFEVSGQPPARGPCLLVCNHISWLDIYVILAVCHCRFVAKAEVGRWPLVGTLATAAGTLFIERESRRDALRVVQQMADRLQAGDAIAVFPEGTSSDGVGVLPFHANLVQAAIAADALVQPAAIRFSDAAGATHSEAACYIDKDTLIGSIWRILNAPPLRATLIFGEQQGAQGRERRGWSADLHQAVIALRTSAIVN